MNDPQPSKVCVLLGEHAYWHHDVLGLSDDGAPLVHNDGGILDVGSLRAPYLIYQPLDGYDDDTIRRHAEAVLDRLIATEGSPT